MDYYRIHPSNNNRDYTYPVCAITDCYDSREYPVNDRPLIYNLVTNSQNHKIKKSDKCDVCVCVCEKGDKGDTGDKGDPGTPGTKINVSNFYALMPGDNTATIAAGAAVEFPNDGITNNTVITRLTAGVFNLTTPGIYEIFFQVSVTEAGQLVMVLNGAELAYTVVGRATGTSQLVGMSLITTTLPGSILSINNVAGAPSALTVTPVAGGSNPVSANIIIKQYV
jgi:hypothetical protein